MPSVSTPCKSHPMNVNTFFYLPETSEKSSSTRVKPWSTQSATSLKCKISSLRSLRQRRKDSIEEMYSSSSQFPSQRNKSHSKKAKKMRRKFSLFQLLSRKFNRWLQLNWLQIVPKETYLVRSLSSPNKRTICNLNLHSRRTRLLKTMYLSSSYLCLNKIWWLKAT